jgi:hypothetical protein
MEGQGGGEAQGVGVADPKNGSMDVLMPTSKIATVKMSKNNWPDRQIYLTSYWKPPQVLGVHRCCKVIAKE